VLCVVSQFDHNFRQCITVGSQMYKYRNKYGVSRSRVIDYVVGEKPFSFGTNHAANAGDHEGRPYSVGRRVTIRNLSTRRY